MNKRRTTDRPYVVCDVVEHHETLQGGRDDGTVTVVNKDDSIQTVQNYF